MIFVLAYKILSKVKNRIAHCSKVGNSLFEGFAACPPESLVSRELRDCKKCLSFYKFLTFL